MNTIRTIITLVAALSCATAHVHAAAVTTTNDSGDGSLRQAIIDANAVGGSSVVID